MYTQICLACAHASMAASNIICCACVSRSRSSPYSSVSSAHPRLPFLFLFRFQHITLYPLRARLVAAPIFYNIVKQLFYFFSFDFSRVYMADRVVFFFFVFFSGRHYTLRAAYILLDTHPIDKLPRFALEAF